MRRAILKLTIFTVAFTSLFAVAKINAASNVILSSDRNMLYCGDSFKLRYQNLDKRSYDDGNYLVRLSCSALGSCIQTVPLRVIPSEIVDLGNGMFDASFTYAPDIEGFSCYGTPNLSVLMDTYKLQVIEKSGSIYQPVSNEITMTFNPYGDPLVRNCEITLINPYTAEGGGKIRVTGKTNYAYNLRNNRNGQNIQFAIPYSGLTSTGKYTQEVTIPGGFLVGGGVSNEIEVVGGAIKNLETPLQCATGIVINNVQFSSNKDSPPELCGPDSSGDMCNAITLACNEPIRFNANGLNKDIAYEVRMVRTTCGAYNQQCNTPATTILLSTQQVNNFSVQKSFKVGAGCTSGQVELDPGNYKVSLMRGDFEESYRTLKLRENQTGSCYLSNVISPIFTGQGGGNSGVRINGAPGERYRVDIVNSGSVPGTHVIGDSRTVDVVIPHELIKTGNNAVNAVNLENGQMCSATVVGKFDYLCTSTSLPEACRQCPEIGNGKQVCTEYEFNGQTLLGCKPDTTNRCANNGEPAPVCDISTPQKACDSCGKGLECVGNTNSTPTCEPDADNSCGELGKYDIIDGIEGNFKSFEDFLDTLRGILIPLGIILGVVFILICGYKVMTSQGQPDKMRDAKDCLTSAIIGMLVVAMSVSIINTLINLAFKLM